MYCFIRISLLESTNLSNVRVDGAAINDKIDILDLGKYTYKHNNGHQFFFLIHNLKSSLLFIWLVLFSYELIVTYLHNNFLLHLSL